MTVVFNVLLFVITQLFVGVAVAMTSPGQRRCTSSADCGTHECCKTLSLPRGKRASSPSYGVCHSLGTTNADCLMSPGLAGPGTLHYMCPCASGYHCVGSGVNTVPLGEQGHCTASSAVTLNAACARGSDCAADECCVSNVRPIGRKRSVSLGGGRCTKMGVTGSGCYVKMQSGKPAAQVFGCPCKSGLTCHGRHVFDIPLGEMGTCGL
ncbi:hypothetical protein ScPMuIL_008497 [Solemya velum]